MECTSLADFVFAGINQQNFEKQSLMTKIYRYCPLFLVIKDRFLPGANNVRLYPLQRPVRTDR